MIFAGSGMWPSMSPTLITQGSESEIGRTFSRNMRSMRSSVARPSPRVRKSAVSWPPTETTGTIGTPFYLASRMKPLRPPKSTRADSQDGRWTS